MKLYFKEVDRKKELFRQSFWIEKTEEGHSVSPSPTSLSSSHTAIPNTQHLSQVLDHLYKQYGRYPTIVFFNATYLDLSNLSDLKIDLKATDMVSVVLIYVRQTDDKSGETKALYRLKRALAYESDPAVSHRFVSIAQSSLPDGFLEYANLIVKDSDNVVKGVLNILSFIDSSLSVKKEYQLATLTTALSIEKEHQFPALTTASSSIQPELPVVSEVSVKWKQLIDEILQPGLTDTQDLAAAISMLKAELIQRRFNSIIERYYDIQENISRIDDSFWNEKSLTYYVRSIKQLLESGRHRDIHCQPQIESMLALVEVLNPNI